MNDKETRTYQNLCDTAKAVLKRKQLLKHINEMENRKTIESMKQKVDSLKRSTK